MLSTYEGRMIVRISLFRPFSRSAAALAVLALGLGLGGCADMSDNVSTAFADPAKYDLYECKQLEPERKNLANRAAELQGLMAKAETGVGGAVVADQAWQRNRCRETIPGAAVPVVPALPPAARAAPPSRAGSSLY